jgi:hypothetical protein
MVWVFLLLGGGFIVYLVGENRRLQKRELALLDALMKKSGYRSIEPVNEEPHKVELQMGPYASVADPDLREMMILDEIAEDVEIAMENRPFTSHEDENQAIIKFTQEATERRRAMNIVHGS